MKFMTYFWMVVGADFQRVGTRIVSDAFWNITSHRQKTKLWRKMKRYWRIQARR